ncbi:MAG: molybdate ABC transporter substrate-binding protein [Bacteroidota bacterium]|nr:molybdate ABC transporter substrate-binding protein [Bacteroidota bacterium]
MRKIAFIVICLAMALVSCHQKQNKKLNIAVAANMQFAMKELSESFTDQTGIPCNLIIGSSGKLTAQIKAGAPFDVFVSADMKYPDGLFKSGYTTNQPTIYAYGKLVMWSMINGMKPSIDLLKSPGVTHIALANPKTAPYGMAAIEVLRHYGIYENVKDKLVYGESISQTNQFITSKSAEVGFTAKSVVLSPELKGKGSWIDMDEADYAPIAQGVVVLKDNNAKQANAEKFYNFLFSDPAKDILKNFGYSVK